MFFFNNKKNSDTKFGNITIIGTSPLSFVLANIIQNNNYDVSILTTKLDVQNFNYNKPFCFKYSNTVSQQSNLSFIDHMTTTPDYCILASDLKDIQTDFLLLQNPLLKDIPLINFVSNYTKKIINIQFIPAYFKGWLQRDKNNISALDRCLEVIFFCNSKSYSNISNIFSNQHLSVTLSDKKQPCFWEQTSPFIIANLLLLKYKQNLSEILPDKNIRKQIDSILNEISFLTAKNSEKFDSSQALASIYSIPSNYKCEIKYAKSFNNIFSALTDVNHFDTPTFHNLIISASNNILV